ncbi:MAG: tetratricopeptide repeat protein [Thermoanaerobaculaceae bacterium]|nr:tetratricopeptide repeat protein [Thermoanaerobaculaceae bacterium]
MVSSKLTTALVVVVACLLATAAAAERKARLRGQIVDGKGEPIPGVTVTITSPDIPNFTITKETDRRGMFVVDYSRVNVTYVYRFEKAGYQPLEVRQVWNLEGTQDAEWTLQPATVDFAAGTKPVSSSPPAVEAYNEGIRALKAKAYQAAEAKLKEAVSYDPNLQQAWAALAVVQVELGVFEQAAASADKAIALGATDEAVLTARWQAYTNLGNQEKAAQALRDLEAIGRRTEEAKRIHNEAVALLKAGNKEAAMAKFQQALNLDPSLPESQVGLATVALELGKAAEAADAAEAVLKGDPKNGKALRLRYNACLALGDTARLADALVGLAAVEPKVARDGLLKLGFDAYDAGRMGEAKERFLRALEIDPNQPLAHYYLAIALINEGAIAEARTHLEAFLKLAPDHPEAPSARDMLASLKIPEPR